MHCSETSDLVEADSSKSLVMEVINYSVFLGLPSAAAYSIASCKLTSQSRIFNPS